jgi:predicted ATPase
MTDKEAPRAPKIVLTGGPGGGKTTAADLFRRELGEKVVVVPEAATMLFSGGFPRTREHDAVRYVQQAIYHVQTNIESVQTALYPERVLLCDRGTVDGGAYWKNGESNFFEFLGTSLEAELARYDAVIFFETAAVGNMSIEGGNPTRNESIEEAINLDKKLKSLWEKHPNFTHVRHNTSFTKKIMSGLWAIEEVLKGL